MHKYYVNTGEKMQALDLYAKIEPLIGFYDAYQKLYDEYITIMQKLNVTTLLDVGCGNGSFLEILKVHGYSTISGIELSPAMVEIAAEKGLDVSCKSLGELQETYSCITAVGDVLNYMDKKTLQIFLGDVLSRLSEGGCFIADINTRYGFEEVTAGSLIKSSEDYLLAIDAEFDGRVLETQIDYFTKVDGLYKREHGRISQYYHTSDILKKFFGKKAAVHQKINLFSDVPDKEIFVFKK